jgi:endonuclease YncB( thermonuclease family)
MNLSTYLNSLMPVTVIEILDGDGFIASTIHGNFEIRLAAIDCPENDQPIGHYAKERLRWLLERRSVFLEIHREQQDCYGRTLATAFVDFGTSVINVNEEMVKCGLAWVYRYFYNHLPEHRRIILDNIERWAQRTGVGLWKDPQPIPPWEWREQRRERMFIQRFLSKCENSF